MKELAASAGSHPQPRVQEGPSIGQAAVNPLAEQSIPPGSVPTTHPSAADPSPPDRPSVLAAQPRAQLRSARRTPMRSASLLPWQKA